MTGKIGIVKVVVLRRWQGLKYKSFYESLYKTEVFTKQKVFTVLGRGKGAD